MSENIQTKIFGMTPGFLIQLAILVVGLTISYVTIDIRGQNTLSEVDKVKAVQEKMDTKVREIETSQIRMDERFTNIMTLLSRIDDRLERNEVRP